MSKRKFAQQIVAALVALSIGFTPLARFSPLAPTPAKASVADCYNAAMDSAKLLETAGTLFAKEKFAECMAKVTSMDPISIAVDAAMAIWGVALSAFDSPESCNENLKTTLEAPIFAMFSALSDTAPGQLAVGMINLFLSLPGTATLINAALELAGIPVPNDPPLDDPVTVDKLVDAGADILYAALQNGPAKLVFDYLTCGCQIAGTFIELGAAGLEILAEAADCAKTAAEALGAIFTWPEALGEWLECGLGHCLTPGVQESQTAYSYPKCVAGPNLSAKYSDQYSADGNTYYFAMDWRYANQSYVKSCDCPPDANLVFSADKKTQICICENPADGYQTGGICGTCPAGECRVSGQCSNPPPGKPLIVNNNCYSCPDGTKYNPATGKCDSICSGGEVFVGTPETGSCKPCGADTHAVYFSTMGGATGGECKKCDTGYSSSAGQTECTILDCEHGLNTTGNGCATQCMSFELGGVTQWLCKDSPLMQGFPVTGPSLPPEKSKGNVPVSEWRMKVEEKFKVLEKVNIRVQEKTSGPGYTGVQIKVKKEQNADKTSQQKYKTMSPQLELPGGGTGSQMPSMPGGATSGGIKTMNR